MNKIGFMQGRLCPMVNNQIQAFPFNNWESEFPLANKLRLSCVEWTLDYPNLRINPFLQNETKNKILRIANKYEIAIPSITLDCCMQKPFWKEINQKSYNELLEDFNLIIKSAGQLESKILVLPLVDNGSINNIHQIDILKKTFDMISDQLEKYGLKIAIESDLPPFKLRKFINNFDSKFIGINYDSGNSASLGYDSDVEFCEYGNRILNLHIKDRTLGGNTVRLGKGNTDFKKLFKNIKNSNYEGNFILQTARGKDNKDFEELKINLSFLKKFDHDSFNNLNLQ